MVFHDLLGFKLIRWHVKISVNRDYARFKVNSHIVITGLEQPVQNAFGEFQSHKAWRNQKRVSGYIIPLKHHIHLNGWAKKNQVQRLLITLLRYPSNQQFG